MDTGNLYPRFSDAELPVLLVYGARLLSDDV
jgi:hypothetical protein